MRLVENRAYMKQPCLHSSNCRKTLFNNTGSNWRQVRSFILCSSTQKPQHTQQARVNHMRGQDLSLCCTSHTFHSASWCCQFPFGGFLRVYWELIRMISRVGTMRLIEWVHVNCFHELSQVWSYSDCKPNLNICEDVAENHGLMGSVLGGRKLICLCLGFRVC